MTRAAEELDDAEIWPAQPSSPPPASRRAMPRARWPSSPAGPRREIYNLISRRLLIVERRRPLEHQRAFDHQPPVPALLDTEAAAGDVDRLAVDRVRLVGSVESTLPSPLRSTPALALVMKWGASTVSPNRPRKRMYWPTWMLSPTSPPNDP